MNETSASIGRLASCQPSRPHQLSRDSVAPGALATLIAFPGGRHATHHPIVFSNAVHSGVAYQAILPALRKALGDPDARGFAFGLVFAGASGWSLPPAPLDTIGNALISTGLTQSVLAHANVLALPV